MSKFGELPPRPALPRLKIGDVFDVTTRNPHDYREFRVIVVRSLCERVIDPGTSALEQVGCPLRVVAHPERILQLARSYEGLIITIRDQKR